MPEHVACNLCGADDSHPVYRLRDYRLRVDDRSWGLVRCRQCGLVYLNPRPARDEIGVYYPDAYFAHRNRLGDRYQRQAARIGGVPGALLEIGSAGGGFLELMHGRGWDVTGIEPSASDHQFDLDIIRAAFPDEIQLPPDSFDVVAAWSVFEHLHDPAAAFRRCAELLRPKGRLVIQVPNFDSVQSRWAKLEDVPRHLYFFTPATLQGFGEGAGLNLDRVEHVTELGPASGRGVMRLGLVRLVGGDVDDFFGFYRLPRRRRFARSPALATAWTLTAGVERLVLTDWLTRTLRISGQIVCTFSLTRTGS